MAKRENLKGREFGKWKVIEFSHTDKNGSAQWKCECECGTIKTISAASLKSGNSQSCGCLRKGSSRGPYKTKKNSGGIYYFQADEIKLKGNYENEGDRRGGEIKEYKMSPAEFEKYMKELATKEVQYIESRG